MIPDNVRRFILTSIPSVPYLEAMLWLRAHPVEDHRAEDLARALYLADDLAQDLLRSLAASGVLSQTPGVETPAFRFQPRDPDLVANIDALAAAYAANLVEIARLVHDATHRNAHRFADAFKLRKDS